MYTWLSWVDTPSADWVEYFLDDADTSLQHVVVFTDDVEARVFPTRVGVQPVRLTHTVRPWKQ